MKLLRVTVILVLMFVNACLPTDYRPPANTEYDLGETLLTENFDQPDAWDRYSDAAGSVGVQEELYRIDSDGSMVWGLNRTMHDDVLIEVDARDLSQHRNNAYGVMCRASGANNGSGYYFLISGDGYYAIYMGEGRDWRPLVRWNRAAEIHTDARSNRIRAICADDYLALYVNEAFMAEVRQHVYTRGYAGLAAASLEDQPVEVEFDDLLIMEASIGD